MREGYRYDPLAILRLQRESISINLSNTKAFIAGADGYEERDAVKCGLVLVTSLKRLAAVDAEIYEREGYFEVKETLDVEVDGLDLISRAAQNGNLTPLKRFLRQHGRGHAEQALLDTKCKNKPPSQVAANREFGRGCFLLAAILPEQFRDPIVK